VVALLGAVACAPGPSVLGPDPDGGGDDDGSLPDVDAGPDAIPPDAVEPTVPPEVDGRIVINEVMSANAVTVLDDGGDASDWIELYNPTDQDIDLHGYALTDDLLDPDKSVLPEGVVIEAGGYLVLWADNQPTDGPLHLDFGLAADAGDVGFARPDGSFIDRVRYDQQETDFAAAREPDGSDRWVIEWHPSPGAANPDGAGVAMGLEDVDAPPESIPAAGDLSEEILGYDQIPQLALTIAQQHIDALIADPFTYVPATLTFRGRSYGPVGVKLKGQNSFAPITAKPSLRINIDEYVEDARWWGLKDLTLNNMDDDYSMMHERLAYMIMREAGVVAPRAAHARLTVNGQSYGLYINVETIKQRMIGRWFDDDTAPLFEATDVDFAAQYVPLFELESGPDDRSMLSGLSSALTAPSGDLAIGAAASFADIAQFQRYWAVASVIAQFDAFPYSNPGDDYFVYADPTSKLTFIPWGMDETFYSSSIDVTITRSILADRCKASPACFQGYVDATWDVVDLIETMDLEAERARVAAQIEPYVVADTRKRYTTAQVHEYQQQLYWFIQGRRLDLEAWLPPSGDSP
jgi:hypothetical protein